jgi:hypothetical protein
MCPTNQEHAMHDPQTTPATTTTPATPTPAEQLAQILARADRFLDRGNAFSYADGASKHLRVMLGDDGRYWVATPADSARLERLGYEYAR